MNQKHFDKLKKMYLQANINTHIFDSTDCTISHEKATISLDISEKYFHALGAIHGAVYFKLLDDAAYFAVSSAVIDAFVLTTSFNTNIIRPVSSGKIIAKGIIRFKSKELFIGESTLYNEDGKEIAFGSGHFAKSKIPLSSEIGYN